MIMLKVLMVPLMDMTPHIHPCAVFLWDMDLPLNPVSMGLELRTSIYTK
jgi:hypothetical protein